MISIVRTVKAGEGGTEREGRAGPSVGVPATQATSELLEPSSPYTALPNSQNAHRQSVCLPAHDMVDGTLATLALTACFNCNVQ